jgi:hypothetical protein
MRFAAIVRDSALQEQATASPLFNRKPRIRFGNLVRKRMIGNLARFVQQDTSDSQSVDLQSAFEEALQLLCNCAATKRPPAA